MSRSRRVLLAGASGLVGRHALAALLRDTSIGELRLLSRADLQHVPADPRVRMCVTEFQHLEMHPDWFDVDQVLCALGTTMELAGSQAAFRRVDFDFPLTIGRLARRAGAHHFALVSAAGANPHSSFFYSRVKGELEHALEMQTWPSLTIARPSLLLGERESVRLGESLVAGLGWLAPASWRPVEASSVAAALVRALQADEPGSHILDNHRLRDVGETSSRKND